MNNSTNDLINQTEWADFLLLGIKSIDLQHTKFFRLIDELKVYNSNNEDNFIINEIICELEAYVEYHFKTEESMFKRSDFPDADEHIKQHNIFKEKIAEFRTAYEFQSTILSDQMLKFLRRWFMLHISDYDTRYVKHIRQRVKDRKNAE